MALQRVVDDHVEIRFLPPDHRESLKGALAPYVTRHIGSSEEFAEAREQAWQHAAAARFTGRAVFTLDERFPGEGIATHRLLDGADPEGDAPASDDAPR